MNGELIVAASALAVSAIGAAFTMFFSLRANRTAKAAKAVAESGNFFNLRSEYREIEPALQPVRTMEPEQLISAATKPDEWGTIQSYWFHNHNAWLVCKWLYGESHPGLWVKYYAGAIQQGLKDDTLRYGLSLMLYHPTTSFSGLRKPYGEDLEWLWRRSDPETKARSKYPELSIEQLGLELGTPKWLDS